MERIGEKLKINSEVFTLTSAAGATSLRHDMQDARKVLACVSVGTTSTGWAGNAQIGVSILEAPNNTAASTAITGATATIGSTAATRIDKAQIAVIQIGSAATSGDTLTINGTTFTYTGSTVGASTAKTFGSTAGSTVLEGLAAASNALAALINTYIAGATASTISTAAVRVVCESDATSLNISCTAVTQFNILYQSAQAMIEINQDRMSTSSRYLSVALTTAATALDAGITIIRDSGYRPVSTAIGPYITLTS